MDYIFKDWKDTLDKFQNCVEKDLAEIRKEKEKIRAMKRDFFDKLERGQFIGHPERIVISAPEIIIGNVDKSGQLIGNGGTIVLRGVSLNMDASGESGTISQRASNIRQLAVDPGPDGLDAVVHPSSSVAIKARSVSLGSEDAKDAFVEGMPGGFAGIHLFSDSDIDLKASIGSETLGKKIEAGNKTLKKRQSDLKKAVSSRKKAMDELFKKMEETMKKSEKLNGSGVDTRSNVLDLMDVAREIDVLSPAFYRSVKDYTRCVAELAEVNRCIKAMDARKKTADSAKSKYKKESTGVGLNLVSENISLSVIDGDGNVRDNETAGVDILSPHVKVRSTTPDGALIDKSEVNINTKTIKLSTASTKMKDEKSGESPAVGDIKITTKTLDIESVDYDIKDGKPEEKALTDKSGITIRTQALDFRATDKEGKAVGHATLNAKAVEIKSMDIDKDSKDDKQLAAGSTMLLVSEKMYAGAKDDKNKSKQVQLSSEKVGVFAKTTAELQQEKATVQLDGGNVSIGGGKTNVFGETTINGKTAFKADVTAPKAAIDNVEAKSSFKSPNISDGMAVPGAPSSASLSQKLKAEDAPKAK